MAIKITLSKSRAGASDSHRKTLDGLGLHKMGQEKILKDTPEILGMIFKVKHLVSHEKVAGEAPSRKRMKPRHVRAREAARAQRTES
jgi:large subunit ribosomal protein L30